MPTPEKTIDNWRALREALAAGPTEGPWVADDNEGFSPWAIWREMSPSGSGFPGARLMSVNGDSAETDATAAYIAAADPTTIRALLDERDRLTETLRDEIAENLRLRELGGAEPDENITAMTERIIAERDRLAAEVEALRADANAYREKAEALVCGLVNEFVDVDFSSWPEMQSVQAEYLAKCDSFVLNGAAIDAARGIKGEA